MHVDGLKPNMGRERKKGISVESEKEKNNQWVKGKRERPTPLYFPLKVMDSTLCLSVYVLNTPIGRQRLIRKIGETDQKWRDFHTSNDEKCESDEFQPASGRSEQNIDMQETCKKSRETMDVFCAFLFSCYF